MLSPRDLAYSLGSFSGAVIEATVSTFAIFYYVDVLKVPAGRISAAMLWCGIWHAVSNPLFGYLSDRTRTRWGRRTPYVAGLALPLCLAFALLWLPPYPPGAADLFYPYYFAVMFLVSGLFTAVMLNLTALYPEMYPEIEDRARVSALRQALGMLGIIVGAAVPPLLYSTLGWRAMGIILGAVSLVTMYAALYGCSERPESASERITGPVESLRLTLFNRSFLTYVVASMLIQYTFVDLQAVIPFYAKYVLGATDSQSSLLLGVVFATAIPSAWVWARLAPLFSPKKSMNAAFVLYGASLIPFFPAQRYSRALAACVPLAAGMAGIFVLLDILIADVVDEDEARTGARREGTYYGVNGLIVRLGVPFNALVMGRVLDRSGYVAGLPAQPAGALLGLRMLMSIVPATAVALAIVALLFYPLDGPVLDAAKKKVTALHAEKAAAQRPRPLT